MKNPLFQLTSIQFKEYYREPGIIFWSIIFPILIAWGLGIAFANKGEMVRHVAVVESKEHPDQTFRSFLMNAQISKSANENNEKSYRKTIHEGRLGSTTFEFVTTSWDSSILLLKRGAVPLIIQEKNGKLEYHFDPANNEAQLTYLQLTAAIQNQGREVSSGDIVPLTRTGTRYIDFLIPGLIAMGVMMTTMWGISYSLIEKRSKKLLRRMVATPMKKSSFLIAQFAARTVLSVLEALLLFFFAYFYFGTTVQGNLIALLIIFMAGVIAFSGIAIFVSSRTAKTEIGNGLINAVVMPMMVLSGIFFSYHNFPQAVIPFIRLLPLTLLADGIRSIFIEGAGLHDILVSSTILSAVGIIFFLAGLKIYRWY